MVSEYLLDEPVREAWAVLWEDKLKELKKGRADLVEAIGSSETSKLLSASDERVIRNLFEKPEFRGKVVAALGVEPAWFEEALAEAKGDPAAESLHPNFRRIALDLVSVEVTFGGRTSAQLATQYKGTSGPFFVAGTGRRARAEAVRQLRVAFEAADTKLQVFEDSPVGAALGVRDARWVRVDGWGGARVAQLARKLAAAVPSGKRGAALLVLADWLERRPDVFGAGLSAASAFAWIATAEDNLPSDEVSARRMMTRGAWESYAEGDATGRLGRLGESFAETLFGRAWTDATLAGPHGWSSFGESRLHTLVDVAAHDVGGVGRGLDLLALFEEVESARGESAKKSMRAKLGMALAAEATSAVVKACVHRGVVTPVGPLQPDVFRPGAPWLAVEWAARAGRLPDLMRREAALSEEGSLDVIAALARDGLSEATLQAWLDGVEPAYTLDAQVWRLQWACWHPRGATRAWMYASPWLEQAWMDVLWGVAHGALASNLTPGGGKAADILLRASFRFRERLPCVPADSKAWLAERVSEAVRHRVAMWPRSRGHVDEYSSGWIEALTPWQYDVSEAWRLERDKPISLATDEPERLIWLLKKAAERGDAWAADVLAGKVAGTHDVRVWPLWRRLPWRFRLVSMAGRADAVSLLDLEWTFSHDMSRRAPADVEYISLLADFARRVPRHELRGWCLRMLIRGDQLWALSPTGTHQAVEYVMPLLQTMRAHDVLDDIAQLSERWARSLRVEADRGRWSLHALEDANRDEGGPYLCSISGRHPVALNLLASELGRLDAWSDEAARALYALGHPARLRARRHARVGGAITREALELFGRMNTVLELEHGDGKTALVDVNLMHVARIYGADPGGASAETLLAELPGLQVCLQRLILLAGEVEQVLPQVRKGARIVLGWARDLSTLPESAPWSLHMGGGMNGRILGFDAEVARRAAEVLLDLRDPELLREVWLSVGEEHHLFYTVQSRCADLGWLDNAFDALWEVASQEERQRMRYDLPQRLIGPHKEHVRLAENDEDFAVALTPRFGRHPRWYPVHLKALENSRDRDLTVRLRLARQLDKASDAANEVSMVLKDWAVSFHPFGRLGGVDEETGRPSEDAWLPSWAFQKVLSSSTTWREEALEKLWVAMLDLPVLEVLRAVTGTEEHDLYQRCSRLEVLRTDYAAPQALDQLQSALIAAGKADVVLKSWDSIREPTEGESPLRVETIRRWLRSAWTEHVRPDDLTAEADRVLEAGDPVESWLVWAVWRRVPARARELARAHARRAPTTAELDWRLVATVAPDEALGLLQERLARGSFEEACAVIQDLGGCAVEMAGLQRQVRQLVMDTKPVPPAG